MTASIGWLLVEVAARLLDAEEREAVRGDLAEAGEGAWASLLHVMGLVVRRQAVVWKSWRPWLAGFGLALPGALLLMGLSLSLAQTSKLDAWILANYGFLDQHRTWLLLCDGCLLISLAWTGGFVLGSISRRTIWVSAILCSLPCLFCLARFRHHPSLSRVTLLLFLLPGIWGLLCGLRNQSIRFGSALALVAVTMMAAPTWRTGREWFVSCALTWPAWYLVATSRKPFWLFRRKADGS